MGKPRDVSTRQGRQLQSCELRLTDPSCTSFGLQIWDAELIRLAQQWTPWETGQSPQRMPPTRHYLVRLSSPRVLFQQITVFFSKGLLYFVMNAKLFGSVIW